MQGLRRAGLSGSGSYVYVAHGSWLFTGAALTNWNSSCLCHCVCVLQRTCAEVVQNLWPTAAETLDAAWVLVLPSFLYGVALLFALPWPWYPKDLSCAFFVVGQNTCVALLFPGPDLHNIYVTSCVALIWHPQGSSVLILLGFSVKLVCTSECPL